MSKENESMALSEEEIIQIIKLIDESDFDELHLEMPGLKLTVRKGVTDISDQKLELNYTKPGDSMVHKETPPVKSAQEDNAGTPVPIESEMDRTEPDETAYLEEEGLLPVKAPLLGIFYKSPKPGAPPYVEVGSYVGEDDTVCLIEVMKLFTAVKAGLKGRITKICVENAQMVEYEQALFLIEPEGNNEESSNA
jgi:acetyl-CoA carboxylase biotin carboxyl carrier protein